MPEFDLTQLDTIIATAVENALAPIRAQVEAAIKGGTQQPKTTETAPLTVNPNEPGAITAAPAPEKTPEQLQEEKIQETMHQGVEEYVKAVEKGGPMLGQFQGKAI